MRKTLTVALFASALVAAATVTSVAAQAAEPTNGYIVMLQPTMNAGAVAAEHTRAHSAVVGHPYQSAISGYSARMSATAAARVARDPRVLLVQADGAVSIAAQTVPTGINRIDAELSPT